MMDIENLIERLKQKDGLWCSVPTGENLIADAATALSTLQAENEKLRAELECTRESLDFARTKDVEIVRLGTELEQVKRERDAAVEDVAAIIGDVEEIRRGYGVDNADADGAFAELCETYCANKVRFCYAECEKYHCKNFKWRGRKED